MLRCRPKGEGERSKGKQNKIIKIPDGMQSFDIFSRDSYN
jgi:hypothetical protein